MRLLVVMALLAAIVEPCKPRFPNHPTPPPCKEVLKKICGAKT